MGQYCHAMHGIPTKWPSASCAAPTGAERLASAQVRKADMSTYMKDLAAVQLNLILNLARAQVRKADMSTYMEDLAAVRPTQMTVVPRLANMMYDHLTTQLEACPAGDALAQAAHKQARRVLQLQGLFCWLALGDSWCRQLPAGRRLQNCTQQSVWGVRWRACIKEPAGATMAAGAPMSNGAVWQGHWPGTCAL